jgi:putative ABC transport system ATP-binding protein
MPTHDMASPQSEPMAPVVAVRNLTRTYGENGAPVHALGCVDLTVASGEFVAIMGPSGCGKSTLLNLIGGLDRPTAGEIDFMGARVDRLGEADWARLRRAQIGFVFQFFNLSAAANIELPCLINGASNREARLRRQELMASLGIEGRAAASPAELSGGEQQRVALARALINRPALVLADEPTGNLDSAAAREVLALLERCNEAGQTILMVTHDPNVGQAAHRIVQMKDGAIVTDDDHGARPS